MDSFSAPVPVRSCKQASSSGIGIEMRLQAAVWGQIVGPESYSELTVQP